MDDIGDGLFQLTVSYAIVTAIITILVIVCKLHFHIQNIE